MNIIIDEKWWTDPRRMAFIEKCGNAADGAAIRLWRVGAEYWKHNKGLIPENVFNWLPYGEELQVFGLVTFILDETELGGGYYVRGSHRFCGVNCDQNK